MKANSGAFIHRLKTGVFPRKTHKFFELNIPHRFATVVSGLLGWRP